MSQSKHKSEYDARRDKKLKRMTIRMPIGLVKDIDAAIEDGKAKDRTDFLKNLAKKELYQA